MRALLAVLVLLLASACDSPTAPKARDNCEQFPELASRGYYVDGLRHCYY